MAANEAVRGLKQRSHKEYTLNIKVYLKGEAIKKAVHAAGSKAKEGRFWP